MTAVNAPAISALPDDNTPIPLAAEMYARMGLAVIKIRPGQKMPDGPWLSTATSDPDAVAVLFDGHTGNIGIACKLSRIVVLDVDNKGDKRGSETLASVLAERDLPPTLTAETGSGKGTHYFFALTDDQSADEIPDTDSLGAGIDIKAKGYVLCAPSVLADGGRYRWTNTVPPAPLPNWLYRMIRQAPTSAPRLTVATPANDGLTEVKRARAYIAKMPPSVQGQNGSAAIFKVASRLTHGFKLAEGDAWDLLVEWNAANASPPWPIEGKQGLRRKFEEARDRTTSMGAVADRPRAPLRAVTEMEAFEDAAKDYDSRGSDDGGGTDEDDDKWKMKLKWQERKGVPVVKQIEFNAGIYLTHAPVIGGKLKYDSFAARTYASGMPWLRPGDHEWTDNDTAELQMFLQERYDFTLPRPSLDASVEAIARRNAFNPLTDWLTGLQWDGKPRVDTWLHRYFGVVDSEYSRLVARCWLISAVARAMQPGCMVKYMLVIEGQQDVGKSRGVSALAGAWCNDTPIAIGTKEAYEQVRGLWIVEMAEMESLNGRSAEQAKSFLGSSIDRFRQSYGRRTISSPRTCVFVATTNAPQFLKDTTGDVRYWPVKATEIDHEAIKADRDQLWAEAVARYRAGEQYWPNKGQEADMCEDARADKTVISVDPLLDVLRGAVIGLEDEGIALCNLRPKLGRFGENMTHTDLNRLCACMKEIGWEMVRKSHVRHWFRPAVRHVRRHS